MLWTLNLYFFATERCLPGSIFTRMLRLFFHATFSTDFLLRLNKIYAFDSILILLRLLAAMFTCSLAERWLPMRLLAS
jgi:hypothetical protein